MDSRNGAPALGRRFILIAVLVAVAPLGAIGLWGARSAARSGRTLLRAQLQAQLAQIRSDVDRRWEQAHADLLMLGENEPVRIALLSTANESRHVPEFMIRSFDQLAAFNRIHVRDRRGVTRWTLQDASPANGVAGAGPAGAPVIEVTVPITDLLTGDTIGSLAASLRVSWLLPSAAALASESGPLTGLFKEDGATVAPVGADGALFGDESIEWAGTKWTTVREPSRLAGVEIAMAGALNPFVGPFKSAARRNAAALLIASGLGLIVIVTLTRRMTRDIEREMAQREALAAVGEFASELAHEVRNPLTAVRLDLQRVEEAAHQPELVRGALARVLCQIDRMDRAVTGALRVARGGSIAPRTVDLIEIIEAARRGADPELQRRRAHSSVDAAPGAGYGINGDPSALEQLFLNLMLNSAQALSEGGVVLVKLARTNGDVVVTIADDGRGMNAEELRRTDKPYRSSRADGNGLGLKIARRVVATHRGEMTVSSTAGVGTTVTVRLPVG